MKRVILYVCFLLISKIIFAQNPYIQHYTSADGLPSNVVYHIYEDSKKFLWFSTDAGVVRYDGSTFTCFRKKDGLTNNEVVRVKEDSQGRIWFFNLSGILNFYYQNKIYNEKNAPYLDSLKCSELFRNFFEDKDQTLYFYYNHNRDIYSLNAHNQVKKYRFASRQMKNFGSSGRYFEGMQIRGLGKNSKGEFLIWTCFGLMKTKSLSIEPQLIGDSAWVGHIFNFNDHVRMVEAHLAKNYEFKFIKYIDENIISTTIFPITNS